MWVDVSAELGRHGCRGLWERLNRAALLRHAVVGVDARVTKGIASAEWPRVDPPARPSSSPLALALNGGFVPKVSRFVPSAPNSSLLVPDSSHFGFCGFCVIDGAVELRSEASVP